MKKAAAVLAVCISVALLVFAHGRRDPSYAGSRSCRECHEKFYGLWSTSMHGLAMRPYSVDFAARELTPQQLDIAVGDETYRADIHRGIVCETGPKGKKNFKIEYALGGKNVYYFLTEFDRGRLQTLPVAYDVNKREWFDTAASGIRHFPGGQLGEPVDWRGYAYTFNTACYSCHVSQASSNYSPQNDSYHTTWREAGINCETCHGPAVEHNRVARATPKGRPLADARIIRTTTMTKAQRNDLCAGCHAKAYPLTVEYRPGEPFYDHFDLATLEDLDFYPDGRDLGENYTLTSWSQSPCVKSGKLDCMHCHTSSGRYRFKAGHFNNACLPCHESKVKNPTAHTHHRVGSEGSKCISCHMPMTSFARMNRSDHSMLPPTPAATIVYKSPNACNLCHKDKDAAWADRVVRKWHSEDYQAPVLRRAGLIDAARRRDWTRLPEMLAYIGNPKRDEVFATSLLRLIRPSPDQKVLATLLQAARNPSPLVRGAAVQALGQVPAAESLQALVVATGDESRLVRVRAAAGLAAFPQMTVAPSYQAQLAKANDEYLASMTARPDLWTSQYGMGNYHLGRGETAEAIASYQAALKLDPGAIMPMVNMSIAYAQMGDRENAEQALQMALAQAPENAAANFNMGLLKAGQNDLSSAEGYLKKAFRADPQMAQAAYNLCIIMSSDRVREAVAWCRKAVDLSPQEPKYAYTLAFYLNQLGDVAEAIKILKDLRQRYPEYKDAETLLKALSRPRSAR